MQTREEPNDPVSPDFRPGLFIDRIPSFRVMLPTAVPFSIPGIHYRFGRWPIHLPWTSARDTHS